MLVPCCCEFVGIPEFRGLGLCSFAWIVTYLTPSFDAAVLLTGVQKDEYKGNTRNRVAIYKH